MFESILRRLTPDHEVAGSNFLREVPLCGTDDRQKRETAVCHFMLVITLSFLLKYALKHGDPRLAHSSLVPTGSNFESKLQMVLEN